MSHTRVAAGACIVVVFASLAQAQTRQSPFQLFSQMRNFGGGMSIMLLANSEVQQEIKLNEDQKELLKELQADLRDQTRAQFSAQIRGVLEGGEINQEKVQELMKKAAEVTKQATEMIQVILEPEQLARLNEIQLQQEGAAALLRPEIAKKLELSKDQQTTIRDSYSRLSELLRQRPQSREGFREFAETIRAARDKQEKEAEAVLTTGQKQKWKALKGKEFDMKSRGFGSLRLGR